MKKNVLFLVAISVFASGSFMDSVGDIVESALGDDDKSVIIKENESLVSTMKEPFSTKKVESILDDVVDSMKSTIGIKEKKKEKHTIVHDTVTVMKEVTGLKTVKKDHSLFSGGIMGEMADMIDLEEGESLGLPSVFGLNKKKDTKVFGSTVLGDTLLGDIKQTGTSFYRGFRNTGESAEFMSGMMYKSSKIYNGMFELFDATPFNIFEEKKEDDTLFKVLDKSNEVLDIFE